MNNFKILIFCSLFLISSCSNKEDSKLLGKLIGSAAGAYLGSKIGSGITNNLSIVIGGTVGLLIGGGIIEMLDNEEKSELNDTINQSLSENPNNVSKNWSSKKSSGIQAEILPLNKYQVDNETCRDFVQIVTKGDQTVEEESTACRDKNGNWRVI